MKKPGVREIAQLAKVSIGTVDRALHGRPGINDKTRERILTIAGSLGYKPNLAARALSPRRKVVRIAICIPRGPHYYFDQLREGMLAEAHRFEHLGVETVYHPTPRLGIDERKAVTEVVKNGKIQALIIAPGNPESLNPIINEAEKGGIRVICVDTDAPRSLRSTVVCVDGTVSGMLSGELMGRFLDPGSCVAVTTGMLQTDDHRKKVDGFCEIIPRVCKDGRVVEVIEDQDDHYIAFEKSYGILTRFKCLRGIYVSTGNCFPVLQAIGVCGLAGKITLVTTELFAEMVPYFKNGTIFASITGRARAQGQIAMRLTTDHFIHGNPLPSRHLLVPHIAMRSNLHLFPEIRSSGAGIRGW